ncbi:phage BR0599 family protein [Geothrix sp. PMB-07]|uniref:phage BR0599 family protein n=1 Tax=Geothrix sp. PMB-07 TaxID=3068640 RepID=UPI0027415DEA|nr:phage BR0599 family protein [Geothrix sp. PMB-07]WLT30763.1 phage BR0599 family protein [Geothrix sp. PMB-07]
MTLASRENSVHDGAPVEFYLFVRGGNRWLYTSDAEPVTTVDGTFQPATIRRNAPSLGKEEKHSTLQLEVARDFPVAMLFRGGAPGSSIWVSVGRLHRGETETEWIWQGKVRGVSWTGSRAQIQCDPTDKALGRATLRLSYGYSCGRRLYSCGVSEAEWTRDAVITSISSDGMTLVADLFGTQADGWWVRGEAYHLDLDARQEIISHVGNSVGLRFPLVGAKAGDALKVVRGCDHLWKRADGSWGDCHSVFNNAANYGGEPFVGDKNPFKTGLDG